MLQSHRHFLQNASLKISVLINNYNYGRFLDRAIASVAAQTRAADEVIVVDDGSTDDSLAVAHRWAEQDRRVRVIAKENRGQLSAFNAGFDVATGDVITFLDADDEYLPGWLQRLEDEYRARPSVDYIFSPMTIVVADSGEEIGNTESEEFDFGLTYFRTLILQSWISCPTSTISARRSLLERFLPCPQLVTSKYCRTNADVVLVCGASVMLGRKLRLRESYVRYHQHGGNVFLGRGESPEQRLIRRVTSQLVMQHLVGEAWQGYVWRQRLPSMIYREFATIPQPGFSDAFQYSRMIRMTGGKRRWRRHIMVWCRWLWLKIQGRA